MHTPVDPPQSLGDEHTLVAQKYAGYFIGHPYRAAQQRVGPGAIQVEWNKPWKEPMVTADSCDFCRHLTDVEAVRRVAGYQHAIDIEVLRPHSLAYSAWLGSGSAIISAIDERSPIKSQGGIDASQANRRRFIEENGDSLQMQPISMVELPLRLKRKLCIEWNHLYRDWLRDNPDVQYDFETRQFYRDIEVPEAQHEEELKDWWHAYMPRNAQHTARTA